MVDLEISNYIIILKIPSVYMYVITFTDRINPLKSVAVTLMDRTQVGSKDVRQLRPEHEEKEILLPVS